jgi:hypothetical protein
MKFLFKIKIFSIYIKEMSRILKSLGSKSTTATLTKFREYLNENSHHNEAKLPIDELFKFYNKSILITRENLLKEKRVQTYQLKKHLNSFIELPAPITKKSKEVRLKAYTEKKLSNKYLVKINIQTCFKTYKKDGSSYLSKPYSSTLHETYIGPLSGLGKFVGTFWEDESEKDVNVVSYTYEVYMNETVSKHKAVKTKHMMKNSYILKDDWLKFSEGIAKTAYEQTDGKCVYHQLVKFLTNPPSGRPIKKIENGVVLNEDNLFNFFNSIIKTENLEVFYPNFNIKSGVSTELIERLCQTLNRSMYAFDDNSKCFSSYVCNSSHYCPIIFYQYQGHCYMIDAKNIIKSMSEVAKPDNNKRIVSSNNVEIKSSELPVFHSQYFDCENAKTLDTGIYLLQQSNIDDEVLNYISTYGELPKTKNRGNVIIKFEYFNQNGGLVSVCCDANYGSNIEYGSIVKVAKTNNIDYVNEGFGSVILSIFNKPEDREFLTNDVKNLLNLKYGNKCALCHIENSKYEYDHITPLASGGSNDTNNFQPLCIDCHRNKTREENEEGVYKNVLDKSLSYFNDIVYENIVDTIQFKSYQFVEKIVEFNNKYQCVEEEEEEEEEEPEIPDEGETNIKYAQVGDVIGLDVEFDKITGKPMIVPKLKKKEIAEICINKPKLSTTINEFKIDAIKCRRNILYHSQFKFPVYSVMDIPKPFNVKNPITCGMYYIITENCFPLRGCGWYFEPLVKYCLNEKLITLNDIKIEFIPSRTLANDHFQEVIDTLLTAFESDINLQKKSVNAYIGLMGRMKRTATSTKFNLKPEGAAEWLSNENNKSKDVMIINEILANGEILYKGIFSQDITTESTNYPIYSMILQMEALELHTLENIIINKGGIPLDRNTDAIRYTRKTEIDISSYYWDKNQTVLKYQEEMSKPLMVEKLAKLNRPDNGSIDKFSLNWNIQYDYQTTVEEKANEIIKNNTSCHIDGRAGTGKTYLVNEIIKQIEAHGKKCYKFSPTNKAARLINGQTIHSLYYKFHHHNKGILNGMMKDVEYIFIDEVSMMSEKFYNLFITIKRTFPNIKFIISGDFGQLPPVCDEWSELSSNQDYELSAGIYTLCDGNRIQLTKCRRSDDKLFELCKNVNQINIKDFPVVEETYKNLAYTHKTRIEVNKKCMDRYLAEKGCEFIELPKKENFEKTQDVKLSVGMPIIAHTTDKKLNIINSETFVIKSINNNELVVKTDNIEIKLKTEDFHKFFYLGFCITIHASQGETFTEKYTIYDWKYKIFSDKAKYVALSRATNYNNIQIMDTKIVRRIV